MIQLVKKLKIGLRKQIIFIARNSFSKFLITIKDVKMQLRLINKKICNLFDNTLSREIDYTAYGFHRHYPAAWDWRQKNLRVRDLSKTYDSMTPNKYGYFRNFSTEPFQSLSNVPYRRRKALPLTPLKW